MEKKINDLSMREFFENVPLYKKVEFDLYKVGEIADIKKIKYLLFGMYNYNENSSSYAAKERSYKFFCKGCNEPSAFKYKYMKKGTSEDMNEIPYIKYYNGGIQTVYFDDNVDDLLKEIKAKNVDFTYYDHKDFIKYEFKCEHCSEKYLMYVLFEKNKQKFSLMKVGQYPSYIDMFGFTNYKLALKKIHKDAINDYRNAIISHSAGIIVASYTYLRRIFEKILYYYMNSDSSINKDEFKGKPTDQKLKMVKKYFKMELKDHLGKIYGNLSKGIHELTESECKKFYDPLFAIINAELLHIESKLKTDTEIKVIVDKLPSGKK